MVKKTVSKESYTDKINALFGSGKLKKGNDEELNSLVVTSSGSLDLDNKLGVGGYTRGRIIEVFGGEGSGKTTLALHGIKSAQENGLKAAFIDAERTYDSTYAKAIGVDTESLIVYKPDNGEDALGLACLLAESGDYGFVVVDSIAACTPKAEIEGEVGKQHVGVHAKLMNQSIRKMTGPADQNKCTIFFVNQTRDKIGVMFGSPITTPGGHATKFGASVRMQLLKKGAIKEGETEIGKRVGVRVVKTKIGGALSAEAEFDVLQGLGISKEAELIELGCGLGIVKKSGAWFSYEDEKIGQGKQNAVTFLRDNPKVAAKIEKEIREKL